MKESLEILLLIIMKSFFRILPKYLRYKIGGFLGVILFSVFKIRKKVTLKNLEIAFPEKTINDKLEIAKKSYKNMAKTFLEMLWLDELVKSKKIKFEGKEILDNAIKKDKGVILLSLHMNNWELGAYFNELGHKVYAVVKEQKNEKMNKYIVKTRTKAGLNVILKGKSSRVVIKALKEKALLGLISDQFIRDVEVNFFGIKTKSPAGAATLALRFDAPVVLMYSVRQSDNSHVIIAEKEIEIVRTQNNKNDIVTNTQIFNDEMEKIIRKYPEQYFWQHNRWKIKRSEL